MHIVIVDNHPIFIRGLQTLLLEENADLTVSGARSLQQAMQVAESRRIELMLLSLDVSGMHEASELIRARAVLKTIAVIAISSSDSQRRLLESIDVAPVSCIHKDTDPKSILLEVHRALEHRKTAPIIEEQLCEQEIVPALPEPKKHFTNRQLSVLKCLMQGKSNKAISRELQIAEGTVKAHLAAIYRELGVTSRLQAMTRAYDLQLVPAL